jgi:hypothetical protein
MASIYDGKYVPVAITLNANSSGKQFVDTFMVTFSTTPASLIEHYFQNGMLGDRSVALFEVRQHERSMNTLRPKLHQIG